jgi:hypothetical protein
MTSRGLQRPTYYALYCGLQGTTIRPTRSLGRQVLPAHDGGPSHIEIDVSRLIWRALLHESRPDFGAFLGCVQLDPWNVLDCTDHQARPSPGLILVENRALIYAGSSHFSESICRIIHLAGSFHLGGEAQTLEFSKDVLNPESRNDFPIA